jgi:putative endopeptidase
LRRLDPRSKDEPWDQTPQTVDASYSVLFKTIELPGGFLQPPYFDAKAGARALGWCDESGRVPR